MTMDLDLEREVRQQRRVVIVGAGFAGYNAARELSPVAGSTEIVVINSTDYFLYLPLMPQVSAAPACFAEFARRRAAAWAVDEAR